jgi:hypothetical protein
MPPLSGSMWMYAIFSSVVRGARRRSGVAVGIGVGIGIGAGTDIDTPVREFGLMKSLDERAALYFETQMTKRADRESISISISGGENYTPKTIPTTEFLLHQTPRQWPSSSDAGVRLL